MTSRERVRKAVSCGRPDRVLIDLSAMRASGSNAVVCHELRKHLGGCDTQGVLSLGARAEIRSRVRRNIATLGPVALRTTMVSRRGETE